MSMTVKRARKLYNEAGYKAEVAAGCCEKQLPYRPTDQSTDIPGDLNNRDRLLFFCILFSVWRGRGSACRYHFLLILENARFQNLKAYAPMYKPMHVFRNMSPHAFSQAKLLIKGGQPSFVVEVTPDLTLSHTQVNTPLNMYSEESLEDTINNQLNSFISWVCCYLYY